MGHNRGMGGSRGAVRRLGRPPSSDSEETRTRILDVARREFAVLGYESTTNRNIAAEAGITTAALYHYFPSKADLYVAVLLRTEIEVEARFRAACATSSALVDRLGEVLDESHRMNLEDPSLAQFLASFRIDVRRHDDIERALPDGGRSLDAFFRELVDDAISHGEIPPAARGSVLSLIAILLVGLSDAMSDDLRAHRRGVEAAKALMSGRIDLGRGADR